MKLEEAIEFVKNINTDDLYILEEVVANRLKEDDTQQQNQDDNQQQPQQSGEQAPATDDANTATQELDNPMAEEVNPDADGDEQIELNNNLQQGGAPATLKMPSSAPIPNGTPTSSEGAPLTLADGTNTQVAEDSSLEFNAIDPDGQASISFESGNYNQLSQMPQEIDNKINTITKTIIPLAEVALIELLGNNKAYQGKDFNATFNIIDGQPKFDCRAVYNVSLFIRTDIEQEDIQHDANYILERLKAVPNVQWNTCSIDCTEGSVVLEFII